MAQRAAEALRRSRAACLDAPISAPTWTGRSGVAGRDGGGGLDRAGSLSSRNLQVASYGSGAPTQPPQRFGAIRNPRAAVGAARASSLGGEASLVREVSSEGLDPGPVAAARGGSSALIARMRERQRTSSSPTPVHASGSTEPDDRDRGTQEGSIRRNPSSLSRAGTERESGGARGGGVAPSDDHDSAAGEMASRLVSFLKASGGEAASSVLVEHFREEVSETLSEVCVSVIMSGQGELH